MARHSTFHQYHQIAADVLNPRRLSGTVTQLLEAAEEGNHSLCEKILKQYKGIVDSKCETTGDTPLIAAARNGHKKVIDLLISHSADCTLQNDNGETVLEVAEPHIKKYILNSLSRADCEMSSAQELLHAAWLGDAVSVKKSLTSDHLLDVNCRNSDGLTPLLLVTRDVGVFDQVHHVMKTEYDPAKVVQHLLKNNSNPMARDNEGRSALHLVANNQSVQARKMVSLLLESGVEPGSTDKESFAPLHIASKMGHTAIVVALIEEGNADINQRGGDKSDTPLMLSASHGHKEATRYLLSKGADVTLQDDHGNDAMSLATTPSLVAMIKDAWDEQAQGKLGDQEATPPGDHVTAPPIENTPSIHPTEDTDDDEEGEVPLRRIHQIPESSEGSTSSFFVTERQASLSSDRVSLTKLDLTVTPPTPSDEREETDFSTPEPFPLNSEVEADDELEEGFGNKRLKPATLRNQVRQTMEDNISKRGTFPKEKGLHNNLTRQGRSNTIGSDRRLRPQGSNQFDILHHANDQQRALQERLSRNHGNHVLRQRSMKNLSRSLESLSVSSFSSVGPSPLPNTPPFATPLPPTPSTDQRRATLPGVRSLKCKTEKNNRLASKMSTSIEHLPEISSNLTPVALVSVDAERENLHVQKLNKSSPGKRKGKESNDEKSMTRSKSLQSMRRQTSDSQIVSPPKRKSLGATSVKRQQSDECLSASKVPFLPSVVTPQFLSSSPSKNPFPSTPAVSKSKQLFSSSGSSRPTPPNKLPSSFLAVVSEDTETSSSSDKTLTPACTPGQVQNPLPKAVTPIQVTPDSKSPPNNLVVNYAVKDDNTPLSPIWDGLQQNQSGSDTPSEYISSYIGAKTPFPHLLISPDHTPNKKGADSGQGESDEERQRSSGSSNDSEVEDIPADREVLKWKRGRVLGRGAFGKVWEGLLDSAKLIAVKEMELDIDSADKAQTQFEKIQQEVDILRSLCHRNIVQYYGASLDNSVVYIFMEYISGGSLQSVLKRFGALDVRTIAHYTRQITKGLDYLHNNGIIHRDIKGANIMVTSKGVVKLIDFGCAKRHCQDLTSGFHSVRGTPYWMAPEVIRGQSYGRKSDIWSLGCTIHEMATTKPPWGELPPEAAMFQIGIGQTVPGLPDHLPSQLKDVFNQCLSREAKDRPAASELLRHPFLIYEKPTVNRKSRRKQ